MVMSIRAMYDTRSRGYGYVHQGNARYYICTPILNRHLTVIRPQLVCPLMVSCPPCMPPDGFVSTVIEP